MIEAIDDVRAWIAERREPQFMLPGRFRAVSFETFTAPSGESNNLSVVERVKDAIDNTNQSRRRRFWSRENGNNAGLFLVGPPGVGKTHLLAAGYLRASGPKLFATFDELVAAAGPLGMDRLQSLITAQPLVFIDEVVLEDPGNIMMLTTLLQHMHESETRVVASANMPPNEAGGPNGWMRSFERELGQITAQFEFVRLGGTDKRVGRENDLPSGAKCHGAILRVRWCELARYLIDTHPMYDAGWLEQVGRIELEDPLVPPENSDLALRFIRFIDRVYDRDVRIQASGPTPDPDDILATLVGDPRFRWHVARGSSRLAELLNDREPTKGDQKPVRS